MHSLLIREPSVDWAAGRGTGDGGRGCRGYDSGMSDPASIDDVSIGGDGIRLGQFLKFAGILDSGGDVKEAIIDGFVTVNGEVDRRRGRQLQVGDVVTFEGRSVRVSH